MFPAHDDAAGPRLALSDPTPNVPHRPLPFQAHRLALNPYGRDMVIAGREGLLIIDTTQPWRAPALKRDLREVLKPGCPQQSLQPYRAQTLRWPLGFKPPGTAPVVRSDVSGYYYRPPRPGGPSAEGGSVTPGDTDGDGEASHESANEDPRAPAARPRPSTIASHQYPRSVRFEPFSIPWQVPALAWHPKPSFNALVAMTWDHEWVVWSLDRPNLPRTSSAHLPFPQLITRAPAHARALTGLAWSPHQPTELMTHSMDTAMRLWDLRTRTDVPTTTLYQWKCPVTRAVYHPQIEHALVASYDTDIMVWDRRYTVGPVDKVEAHSHRVYSMAFDPRGRGELLTGSYDGIVRLWDCTAGRPVLCTTLRTGGRYSDFTYTPFGRGVAASGLHNGTYQVHLYHLDDTPSGLVTGSSRSSVDSHDNTNHLPLAVPAYTFTDLDGLGLRDLQWRAALYTTSVDMTTTPGPYHIAALDLENRLHCLAVPRGAVDAVSPATKAKVAELPDIPTMADLRLRKLTYSSPDYAQVSVRQLQVASQVRPASEQIGVVEWNRIPVAGPSRGLTRADSLAAPVAFDPTQPPPLTLSSSQTSLAGAGRGSRWSRESSDGSRSEAPLGGLLCDSGDAIAPPWSRSSPWDRPGYPRAIPAPHAASGPAGGPFHRPGSGPSPWLPSPPFRDHRNHWSEPASYRDRSAHLVPSHLSRAPLSRPRLGPAPHHRSTLSDASLRRLDHPDSTDPAAALTLSAQPPVVHDNEYYQRLLDNVVLENLPYPSNAVAFLQDLATVSQTYPGTIIHDVKAPRNTCQLQIPMPYDPAMTPHLWMDIQYHPERPTASPWYELKILGGLTTKETDEILYVVRRKVDAALRTERKSLRELVPFIFEAAEREYVTKFNLEEYAQKVQQAAAQTASTVSPDRPPPVAPTLSPPGRPHPLRIPAASRRASISSGAGTAAAGYAPLSRSLGTSAPRQFGLSKLRHSIVPPTGSDTDDDQGDSNGGPRPVPMSQFSRSLGPHPLAVRRRPPRPRVRQDAREAQFSLYNASLLAEAGSSPARPRDGLLNPRDVQFSVPPARQRSSGGSTASPSPSSSVSSRDSLYNRSHGWQKVVDRHAEASYGSAPTPVPLPGLGRSTSRSVFGGGRPPHGTSIPAAAPTTLPFDAATTSNPSVPDYPDETEDYYRSPGWLPSESNSGPYGGRLPSETEGEPYMTRLRGAAALSTPGGGASDDFDGEFDDEDEYDVFDEGIEDDDLDGHGTGYFSEGGDDDDDDDDLSDGAPDDGLGGPQAPGKGDPVPPRTMGHLIMRPRASHSRNVPFPRLCGGTFNSANQLVCFFATIYTRENVSDTLLSPATAPGGPLTRPVVAPLHSSTNAERLAASSTGTESGATPNIADLIAGDISTPGRNAPFRSTPTGGPLGTPQASATLQANQLRFLRFHMNLEHFRSYDLLEEFKTRSQFSFTLYHRSRGPADDTGYIRPLTAGKTTAVANAALTRPSVRILSSEDEDESDSSGNGTVTAKLAKAKATTGSTRLGVSQTADARRPPAAAKKSTDGTTTVPGSTRPRRLSAADRPGSAVTSSNPSRASLGVTSPSVRSLKSLTSDQALQASGASAAVTDYDDDFSHDGDDSYDEAALIPALEVDDDGGQLAGEEEEDEENDFLTLPSLFVRNKPMRPSPDPVDVDPFFPPVPLTAGHAPSAVPGASLGNYVYLVRAPAVAPVSYELARTYRVHGRDPVDLARHNAALAALHGRPDLVATFTIVMYLLTNYAGVGVHVKSDYLQYVDPLAPLFAPSLIAPYATLQSLSTRPPPGTTTDAEPPTIAQLLPQSPSHAANEPERFPATDDSSVPCPAVPSSAPAAGIDLSFLGYDFSMEPMTDGDSTAPRAVQWGAHPLGRALVAQLFAYYERQDDIQTLCLLACLLSQPFPPTPPWMVLNDRRTWNNNYTAAFGRPLVPTRTPSAPHPLCHEAGGTTDQAVGRGALTLALPPPPSVPPFASLVQSPAGLTTPLSHQSGQLDYFGSRWAAGLTSAGTVDASITTHATGTPPSTSQASQPPPAASLSAGFSALDPAPSVGSGNSPAAAVRAGLPEEADARLTVRGNAPAPIEPDLPLAAYAQLTGNPRLPLTACPPATLSPLLYPQAAIVSTSLSPKQGWIYPPIFKPVGPNPLTAVVRLNNKPPPGLHPPPGNLPPPVSAGPFVGNFSRLPFPPVSPGTTRGPRRQSATHPTQAPPLGTESGTVLQNSLSAETSEPIAESEPASHTSAPLPVGDPVGRRNTGTGRLPDGEEGEGEGDAGYEVSASVPTQYRIMNWLKPSLGRLSGPSNLPRKETSPRPSSAVIDPVGTKRTPPTSSTNQPGRRRGPPRPRINLLPTFTIADRRRQLAHEPVGTPSGNWTLATNLDDSMDNDYNPHWMPLLDPQCAATFDHYRMLYAEMLGRWGLSRHRAEVLKFVQTPGVRYLVSHATTSQMAFEVAPTAADSATGTTRALSSTSPALPTSHKGSATSPSVVPYQAAPVTRPFAAMAVCAVCRQIVKGTSFFCWRCGHTGHAEHLQAWFEADPRRTCPSGCGCHCFAPRPDDPTPNSPFTRPASKASAGGRTSLGSPVNTRSRRSRLSNDRESETGNGYQRGTPSRRSSLVSLSPPPSSTREMPRTTLPRVDELDMPEPSPHSNSSNTTASGGSSALVVDTEAELAGDQLYLPLDMRFRSRF